MSFYICNLSLSLFLWESGFPHNRQNKCLRSILIMTYVRVFVQIILCLYEDKITRKYSFYFAVRMKQTQTRIKYHQIKTEFYQTKSIICKHDKKIPRSVVKKKCSVKLVFVWYNFVFVWINNIPGKIFLFDIIYLINLN